MSAASNPVDFRSITDRQQATWATGDFNEIARQIIPVSEDLIRVVDPHAGWRVLDVACGSGNAALAASHRNCDVVGIDYVPALIERANLRAQAEGVRIDFRVADAQALPFPDASFDAVVSVFGVMFAPDQTKSANELVRVLRPGGTIGLSCWMPEGFGIDFFGAHAKHVPPPPGLDSPLRWGTEAGITALLGSKGLALKTTRRIILQYYRTVEHAVETFAAYFGPTARAMTMLDANGQASLKHDLGAVFAKYNRATDGTLAVECVYLETIAKK